jgi:hypothetical protein
VQHFRNSQTYIFPSKFYSNYVVIGRRVFKFIRFQMRTDSLINAGIDIQVEADTKFDINTNDNEYDTGDSSDKDNGFNHK